MTTKLVQGNYPTHVILCVCHHQSKQTLSEIKSMPGRLCQQNQVSSSIQIFHSTSFLDVIYLKHSVSWDVKGSQVIQDTHKGNAARISRRNYQCICCLSTYYEFMSRQKNIVGGETKPTKHESEYVWLSLSIQLSLFLVCLHFSRSLVFIYLF